MIALVTQFDDPTAMPSGATPSGASSSSSCCCCCIVTAIGASIVSGLHVRSIRLEQAGASPESPPAHPWYLRPWPEILGFLALAIAIGVFSLGTWIDVDAAAYMVVFVFLTWGLLLHLAYRGARDDRSVLHPLLTIAIAFVVALVEFFVWLSAFS